MRSESVTTLPPWHNSQLTVQSQNKSLVLNRGVCFVHIALPFKRYFLPPAGGYVLECIHFSVCLSVFAIAPKVMNGTVVPKEELRVLTSLRIQIIKISMIK